MPRKIFHVHDRALRQAMSDPRVAEDFLRHYLPKDIQGKVRFETLTMMKETYVDEALDTLVTDVLYSVQLNHGQRGLIYFLIEHFSKPKRMTPWIVLKYMCKIMEHELKKPKIQYLPLIIPIVIYNGQTAYPYSINIYDLFSESTRDLAEKYMFKGFQLIDLSQIPDEQMSDHRWSALMEILMKHAYSRDIMNSLEALSETIKTLVAQEADAYVLAMLKYVIECSENREAERFIYFLKNTLPKSLEVEAMTLAQLWKQEGFHDGMQQGIQQGMQQGMQQGVQQGIQQGVQQGIQQGVQQGIQQGVQQGIQQGLAHEKQLLMRLIKRRFPSVPNVYITLLEQADPDRLLDIGERILEAKTLEDIFVISEEQ